MKSSILTISLLLALSMQAEAKTSSRVASSRKGMRVMNRTVAPINTSTTTTSTEEEEEIQVVFRMNQPLVNPRQYWCILMSLLSCHE